MISPQDRFGAGLSVFGGAMDVVLVGLIAGLTFGGWRTRLRGFISAFVAGGAAELRGRPGGPGGALRILAARTPAIRTTKP
jgi:hypothetical protein